MKASFNSLFCRDSRDRIWSLYNRSLSMLSKTKIIPLYWKVHNLINILWSIGEHNVDLEIDIINYLSESSRFTRTCIEQKTNFMIFNNNFTKNYHLSQSMRNDLRKFRNCSVSSRRQGDSKSFLFFFFLSI